jgi:anhydro-N-acetylmuramic acid kinase
LRQALRANLNQETYDPMVESQFTLSHIAVMDELLSQTGFTRVDIDIIGFHGQTTHHDPAKGITVQMGNGELLSDETGIDVVYDFRKNDMANGGQGAPFLPIYHRALVQNAALNMPLIVLNLGGVGNITWISGDDMIAFDTGPANAMIDDWVKANTNKTYDENGDIAASGEIDAQKIAAFLSHPYFDLPYPKSLDRNDFDVDLVGMSLEDGAATLTEMTVQSVAKGVQLCPETPTAVYVTGGGRHNAYMMQCLSDTTGIDVQSVDTLGWNGDAMEAEGFAYMAVRTLLNEPISFPGTTGCITPTVGGFHAKPNKQAA